MKVLINEEAVDYLEKIIDGKIDVDPESVGITGELLAFRPLGDSLEFRHCKDDVDALKFIQRRENEKTNI